MVMDKKLAKQLSCRKLMTPEEQIERAQRARWRFKSIVRLVMQNIYWLEDVEDQSLGDDVQKNIMVLTRKKGRSLLSLQEKSILNKSAEYRTEAEKQRLSRIIGGLKCFRRYPNHVKSKLAGVTYFFYFGPGRTIVRQGGESEGLYFIVTGEVTVSQESFDPVLNEMIKQDIAIMGPDNMFGEVGLLHDIPRTSTIITNTHVELLCLKKKDFDEILKTTVQKQWNEIQMAMSTFTYFHNWNEIAIRECCILSSMKSFQPDATILGDGVGLQDFVYFIITGKCRVIEQLLVTSEKKGNKKLYKLYEPQPVKQVSSVGSIAKQELSPCLPNSKQTQVDSKSLLIEFIGDKSDSKSSISNKLSSSVGTKRIEQVKSAYVPSGKHSTSGIDTVINLATKTPPHMSNFDLPSCVETHLMQVCLLNPTACFGIGENMRHRRVVAVTLTECLLIPRYWLMQKNNGNIWNRVQQFLNIHIPTTKQVFKAFVGRRKWMEYRKQVFNDVWVKRRVRTNNSLKNVPYHIRIHEKINI